MRIYLPTSDTGQVTLGTNSINAQTVQAKVLGSIVGFKISVSASAAGTLTSPNAIEAAVQQLKISDSAHQPIHQISGLNLVTLAYHLSPYGTYVSPTSVSSSNATDTFLLFAPVSIANQPVYIDVTFAPYSALASSGATGGTAEVAVDLIIDTGARAPTLRSKVFTAQVVSGTTDISSILGQLNTISLVFDSVTEADFTNMTFRAAGGVEIESKPLSAFVAEDTYYTDAGHKSGILALRASPFLKNPATLLKLLATGSFNPNVYQLYI